MLLLRATLSCPTLLPLKIKAAKVLIILGIAKKKWQKDACRQSIKNFFM
jgi:hypothetical protein